MITVRDTTGDIVGFTPAANRPKVEYDVRLIRYSKPDGVRELDNLLVAKFVALGDAVNYARDRAMALKEPEAGRVVFEVYNKRGHKLYRGG